MGKKCKSCGVPLEGLGYSLIAKPLFGILPSRKKPGLCSKCEAKPQKKKR